MVGARGRRRMGRIVIEFGCRSQLHMPEMWTRVHDTALLIPTRPLQISVSRRTGTCSD
jgi:hypothetical protein